MADVFNWFLWVIIYFVVLVLLPHIAGRNTIEASMEKAQLAADNILAVLNNQPVPCEVKL